MLKDINIPAKLNFVLSKATEQDPRKRYSSIAEFRDALFFEVKPSKETHPYVIIGGKKHYINKNVVTIGRLRNADIHVKDDYGYVSRIHCMMVKRREGYLLVDNKSTGGVFVYSDGVYKRIEKWWLKDGDIIALCYDRVKGPYITFQFKEA